MRSSVAVKPSIEYFQKVKKYDWRITSEINRKINKTPHGRQIPPILKKRRRLNISLNDLAECAGVAPSTLRVIESDKPGMVVHARSLIKLAKFFRVKHWTNLITGDC